MFFIFLMLAVQIAVTMYATSTVSALGHDAARRAAGAGATPASLSDAEAWFRSNVGPSVDVESMEWSQSDGALALSIVVTPPDLLIARTGLIEPIERTYVVRIEELQPLSEGP